jgi:REP element-mobilizing transposase RayT
LFGHIVDGEMELDDIGRMVEEQWLQTAEVRPNVELDEFVIMPNHFHGILIIVDDVGPGAVVGASRRLARSGSDAHGPSSGSIGAVMAQFKSIVTKHVNGLPDMQGVRVWQRNYFEHIIRNEPELDRIRVYIAGNSAHWAEDNENQNAANDIKRSAF